MGVFEKVEFFEGFLGEAKPSTTEYKTYLRSAGKL
jgi:hypothetical protein